jgi:predicted acyl esterase
MPGPIGTEPAPVPESAHQHLVRMRDGVRLATDVYLPQGGAEDAAYPVVLIRLPYDKNSRYVFMEQVAGRLTRAGYATVVQDVRGKYRSEGDPLGPVTESRDGYDTIDWIASQSWCDGAVGMFGDSYYGFTQWAAVSSGHPALRAIVPRVTTADLSIFLAGGSGEIRDVDWLTGACYMLACWTGRYVNERMPDWKQPSLLAAFEREFEELGERSHWFDLSLPHPVPVPVYPDGHPFTKRPIPTLHAVGWFDNVAIPHMRDYARLAAMPDWGPLQYLWADSVDHENYHLSEVPIATAADHDSDPEALERLLDLYIDPAIEFFDVFLKGGDSSTLPKVRWHLGHVGYRTSSAWPPPESEARSLYLTDGTLTESAPTTAEAVSWTYDPADAVPSALENSFAVLFEYPDERATGERDDVLVFDGTAATEPLDLAGPVDLWVRVGSTAPTTDVFAKLLDVDPEGSARMIVRGQAVLTRPDADRLVRIEMGHTGYRLRPGHRLRLHLTSSDFPEYAPSPGTAENRWTAEDRRPSIQRLVTDASAPVRLDLRVLPATRDRS